MVMRARGASDGASAEQFLGSKETQWLTNSDELARSIAGVCSNFTGRSEPHRHVHLMGGSRVAAVVDYPPALVTAILRAFRRHMV